MSVLTTLLNGGSLKDFRDTMNAMLADIAVLKGNGSATPTPTPTPTPTVTISGAISKPEGNSGATVFVYTVTRSTTTGAVAVPWSFAAGSTSADDYTGGTYPAGGSVALAAGVSSGTISISVNGDSVVEGDETFTVSITVPSGYAAGAATSATGTILNDDTAPPPLTYLPATPGAGATYMMVYSAERLLSGYAGALMQTGGASDLGAGATGVTPAAVQTARAGAADGARVSTLYDQSGGGRHALTTSAAERPGVHEDVVVNGKVAIAFDGRRFGGGARRLKASGVNANRQAVTVICVMDPTTSLNNAAHWAFLNGADSAMNPLVTLDYGLNGTYLIANAGGLKDTGKFLPAVPHINVVRGSASATDIFINADKYSASAPTGGAMADFSLGCIGEAAGNDTYNPCWRCLAMVVVAGAISDAEVAAIRTALVSRFSLTTIFDRVVALYGTSRVAGGGVLARNKLWYERLNYAGAPLIYNMGIDGSTMKDLSNDMARRIGLLYRGDLPLAVSVDDQVNDLGGINGAPTAPADIYATMKGIRDYAKGLGGNVRVVFQDTLPQNSSGFYGVSSADMNANRVTLNNLIQANTAAADAVARPSINADMGNYTASTDDAAKYLDRLHPTTTGYSYLGSYGPAAINAALA